MKKLIVCYFASIGSLLGFMVAINMNQIPLAVIMVALFVACMLWFTDIARQKAKRGRHRSDQAKRPQEFYSIDIPLDDEPEDKPAAAVRPGSRPSVTYLEMKTFQERGRMNDFQKEA